MATKVIKSTLKQKSDKNSSKESSKKTTYFAIFHESGIHGEVRKQQRKIKASNSPEFAESQGELHVQASSINQMYNNLGGAVA